MDINIQKSINIVLFIAIIVLFIYASLTYTPVFVIYFAWIILTIIFIRIGNKNNKEYNDTITIFLSSLFFGFLLAIAVNADFINNEWPFLYPDQKHFFEEASFLGSCESLPKLFESVSEYIEYNVIYGLFGLLAYLDMFVSNSINFLPLIISVVYVTSLIPLFFYHTIKLYLSNDLAFKGALFYALFTPIMGYSGYLLRDNHISLLTMIALFWMVRKVTITRVIGIVALIPIVAGMRLSNSLLILGMLAIYIFSGKTSKILRYAFIIAGFGFLIYFSNEVLNTINSTQSRIDNYEIFTAESIENSAGLSKWIYILPPGLKEVASIIFVLSAFPFGSLIRSSQTTSQFVMAFYSTITNIGWYFLFFGLFYFSKPLIVFLKKKTNRIFLMLIILFIAYIFANSSNLTFRRLIAVFPFAYAPFLIIYENASNRKKSVYKKTAFISAFLLTVIYFLLL